MHEDNRKKKKKLNKKISYLPTSSLISWLLNNKSVKKICHWSSLTSLCAFFYHFLMSPFFKCSDALILIEAVTIPLGLTMSQVLS